MESSTRPTPSAVSSYPWVVNAGVATAYLLLAGLGAWLAFPPGYAAPLAPAAGLALASLLVRGARVMPGVGLGALLYYLLLDVSSVGLIAASAIAAAVLLQAWLAFRLTRSLMDSPTPLIREGEIIRFLLLAGPVSGTVSATIGVVVLWYLGTLAPSELAFQWLAWWVGQSLGVALFTPLLLLAWPGARTAWSKGSGRIALSLLVTAALLAAGDLGLDRLERSQARAVEGQAMQQAFDAGFPSLEAAVAAARSVERFYAASKEVTRAEFAVFTEHTLRRQGLVALEWLLRVERADRPAYEAAVQRELGREFEIAEYAPSGERVPAGERAVYFPGHFVEPMEGNEAVLGFDYLSDPARRPAIERAWQSREVIATEPVRLVQTGRPGILLFVPVYQLELDPATATDSEHPAALEGFVLAVFDIDAVLAPLGRAAEARALAFRLSDRANVQDAAGDRILADTLPPGADPNWRRTVPFAGRELLLEMHALEPYWRQSPSTEAGVFLVFSLLAGLLLAFTTLAGAGRNMSAEARVAQRTAHLRRELQAREAAETALRESEHALAITLASIGDGVLATDTHGRVTRLNPVAEEMTGWRAEAARARPVSEVFRIINEETREPVEIPVDTVLRTRRMHGLANHTTLVARDGTERAIADSAAPILDASGVLHGAVLVFRDVDAERAAERALERSEARYRRFIQLVPYGVFVQCEGRFEFLNPRAVQTLGAQSEAELAGRPVLDFLHADSREAVRERMRRLNEERQSVPPLAERWLRLDGSEFDGEATAVPYEHEGTPGALVLLQDISERKEAERRIQALNRDLEGRVREREDALQTLHQKEEEIRAVVDNLFDCVITIDARGTVRSVNRAVSTVFGYRRGEVVGHNVSMLMAESDVVPHEDYFARYLETGTATIIGFGREVTGRHRDGHEIPLLLNSREYEVRGQRTFVGIMQDISERKRLIEELTVARDDAEQATRAKSAFLATMSHEIRTPMNGVVGLVDVLEHSQLSPHQADLVRTVQESAASLLRIIDDILDFSKIEAGRLEIERTPVSIADLVEGLGNSLMPGAARRGVDLVVFVDPRIPARVLSDDVRLRQVLYNLIGNAIKFSSGRAEVRGRVSVRADLIDIEPLQVQFSVSDNGIGMTPDTVDKLFQAFSQAEVSTTRRFGGTGLGLAICNRLVDLLSGSIAVESQAGKGSTFRVLVPFESPAEQPDSDFLDLSGVFCVLLEDPKLQVADLCAYLEHAGATVHITGDITDVGRVASGHSTPVVMIQWLELGARPKNVPQASNLRHLRITRGRRRRRARVTGEDTVTLDGGALRRLALVRAVAVAAGIASPDIFHDHGEQLLPGKGGALPDVEQARAEGRLILVAEDDAVNQKVILQQLGLLGLAAEVAADGQEALEMWRKGGYALILTDLHMPRMDGYAFAEAVRGEESAPQRTPILALTANALRGEASRAKAAGMDEYLTKPLPLERLRVPLEKWLPALPIPPAAAEQSEAEEKDPQELDVSVLMKMVGDDTEILTEILGDYLVSLKGLGDCIRASIDSDALSEVAALAHRLKSSSRSVGALALGEIAAELEVAASGGDMDRVDRLFGPLARGLDAVGNEARSWIDDRNAEAGDGMP